MNSKITKLKTENFNGGYPGSETWRSARRVLAFAKTSPSSTTGYAFMELIFYVAFFALLSLVIINSMITMMRAFRETTVYSELQRGGGIMEKISREVRHASSISSISANDLNLGTTDTSGNPKTVRILHSSPNVELWENGALSGNLNTPNITVAAVNFTEITTARGKAVKILITVRSNNDTQNRTKNFYNTIVLRGEYND